MGKEIVVSIISEHNIPNISLIRNMFVDTYLDILTKKSKESFYDSYINAVTDNKQSYITSKFDSIIVDESDPENIIDVLSTKSDLFDEAKTIYVNVTGGTKLLSLYTYIFFKERYALKSKFYYMNITSSSNIFIDLDLKNNIEMKTVLTLEQYLRSYNYEISKESKAQFSFEVADIIIREYTGTQYLVVRSALNNLLEILNRIKSKNKVSKFHNSFDVREVIDDIEMNYGNKVKYSKIVKNIVNNKENMCEFLDNIANRVNHSNFRNSKNMNIKTLKYVISVFLEEYIYNIIKREIFTNSNQENMINENIKQSIRLKNTAENEKDKDKYIPELDILFCFNNTLCYIECKSGAYPDLINDATIKQKAISSTLSISAYNVFVVLNEYTEANKQQLDSLKGKAEKFKIKIVTKEELLNGLFIEDIKKHLKIM